MMIYNRAGDGAYLCVPIKLLNILFQKETTRNDRINHFLNIHPDILICLGLKIQTFSSSASYINFTVKNYASKEPLLFLII